MEAVKIPANADVMHKEKVQMRNRVEKGPGGLENQLPAKGDLSDSKQTTMSTNKHSGLEYDDGISQIQSTLQRISVAQEQEGSKAYCDREKIRPPSSEMPKQVYSVDFCRDNCDALPTANPSPERAPPGDLKKKKLLILDMNGILVDIQSHAPKGYTGKKIGKRAVFKRPFYSEFLNFCFERFDVGIWSSRSKSNIDKVVDYLLGHNKQKLLFCWDLSHCTETGFKTLENKHKPLVFKELRHIWNNCDPDLPWNKGDYDESNTLLVDDSPYKALLNPPHTAIFPSSFTCLDRSDNSLGFGGDLRVYLEGLAVAEDVKTYVEQHPFGQSALTEKSPSWGYYLKILRTMSSSDNPSLCV